MISKTATGHKVDFLPWGRSDPRVRKSFKTKPEAPRYIKWVLEQSPEEGNEQRGDSRCLSELVELWYQAHGIHLNDGEARKRKLSMIVEALGNPVAQAGVHRLSLSENRCRDFSQDAEQ